MQQEWSPSSVQKSPRRTFFRRKHREETWPSERVPLVQVDTGTPEHHHRHLFGCPLEDLWEDGLAPKAIRELLGRLWKRAPWEPGVFRRSPGFRTSREIRNKINANCPASQWEHGSPVALATSLKEFLRSVPGGFFPRAGYDDWVASVGCADQPVEPDVTIDRIQTMLCSVSGERRALIGSVFRLLRRVSDNAHWSHMTSLSLSVCTAPSMLWAPGQLDQRQEGEVIDKIVAFVQYLIDHCHEVFGEVDASEDPNFLLPEDATDQQQQQLSLSLPLIAESDLQQTPEPHDLPRLTPEPHADVKLTPEPHTEASLTPDPHADFKLTPDQHTDHRLTPELQIDLQLAPDPHTEPSLAPEPHSYHRLTPEPRTDAQFTCDPNGDFQLISHPRTRLKIHPVHTAKVTIGTEPDAHLPFSGDQKPDIHDDPNPKTDLQLLLLDLKTDARSDREPSADPRIPPDRNAAVQFQADAERESDLALPSEPWPGFEDLLALRADAEPGLGLSSLEPDVDESPGPRLDADPGSGTGDRGLSDPRRVAATPSVGPARGPSTLDSRPRAPLGSREAARSRSESRPALGPPPPALRSARSDVWFFGTEARRSKSDAWLLLGPEEARPGAGGRTDRPDRPDFHWDSWNPRRRQRLETRPGVVVKLERRGRVAARGGDADRPRAEPSPVSSRPESGRASAKAGGFFAPEAGSAAPPRSRPGAIKRVVRYVKHYVPKGQGVRRDLQFPPPPIAQHSQQRHSQQHSQQHSEQQHSQQHSEHQQRGGRLSKHESWPRSKPRLSSTPERDSRHRSPGPFQFCSPEAPSSSPPSRPGAIRRVTRHVRHSTPKEQLPGRGDSPPGTPPRRRREADAARSPPTPPPQRFRPAKGLAESPQRRHSLLDFSEGGSGGDGGDAVRVAVAVARTLGRRHGPAQLVLPGRSVHVVVAARPPPGPSSSTPRRGRSLARRSFTDARCPRLPRRVWLHRTL